MEKGVKFEYVPWKNSDFVSFQLFGFTLLIKLRNSLKYFNFFYQKKMMPDLNMSCLTVLGLV